MKSPTQLDKQLGYLRRFYSNIERLSLEELEEARKARGTSLRFVPYRRMLISKIPSCDMEIYYAPFDFVNTSARVVILGITPDYNTMYRAYSYALKNKWRIKGNSRFRAVAVGAARNSLFYDERIELSKMIDVIGLNKALGVNSCREIFDAHPEVLHSTTVMRYPTFKRGMSYAGIGGKPELLSFERFREDFVNVRLADELSSVTDALIIPLGDIASEVLLHLISRRVLNYKRCLLGFPNPSKLSAERWNLYSKRKTLLVHKVQTWQELEYTKRAAKAYRQESKLERFFHVHRVSRSRKSRIGINYIRTREPEIWKAVHEIPRNLVTPRNFGIRITHLLLTGFYFSGPKYLERKLRREGIMLSPKARIIADLISSSQKSAPWDRVLEWVEVKDQHIA